MIPVEKSRIRVESQQTADIINGAHRELTDMAPSMLKKKVVEFVFLPWLTRFTGRVVQAAKEEERQAILLALPPYSEAANDKFRQGYNAALKEVRSTILHRGDVATKT